MKHNLKIGDWVHYYLHTKEGLLERYAVKIIGTELDGKILHVYDGVDTLDIVPVYHKFCRKLKKPPHCSYHQGFKRNGKWGKKGYLKDEYAGH